MKILRRSITLLMMSLCSVMLFACGEKVEPEPVSTDSYAAGEAYAYVPEFFKLGEQSEFGESRMRQPLLQEDKLYYEYFDIHPVTGVPITYLEYRELGDFETVHSVRAELNVEERDTGMSCFTLDEEGNLYVVWNTYPKYVEGEEYNYEVLEFYLTKHNEAGELLEEVCLSETFSREIQYVSDIVVDKEQRIYISTDSQLLVYDKRLKNIATIDTGTLHNLFVMEGDRVFGIRYDFEVELVELDVKKKEVKATYGNIPGYGGLFADGGNGKLLYVGSDKLYEYNLETEEAVEVLDWVDCYVDGNSVQDFRVLKNGSFAVVSDNYEDSPEVILLTRTPKEQVAEREELTLAVFAAGDWKLQQTVVNFNKSNDKYKVKVKAYYDYNNNAGDGAYEDAMNLLYVDIVSGEAPDVICLRDLDMFNLADSKALVDLKPYLESSTIANRSDFEQSILEAYNIEGVQVTVPTSVWLHTLIGKERLVGEEPGWTVEEILTLKEAYPEAILLEHLDRNGALEMCLEYGSDAFIDYETGACSFDSEAFIKVLEFAKGFGAYGRSAGDTYEALQEDNLLLLEAVVTKPEEYQKTLLMLEEPAVGVGYPTADGTPAVGLTGWDTYAIANRSDKQDGAWVFIEYVLSETDADKLWGFPTRTALLEEMFAEAMEPVYKLDERGEILYDEAGEPIQEVKTTWGNGSWTGEIYAATEEEIEDLRQMIASARVAGMPKQRILDIIKEEAAAYFAGQKSAEEVAKIIQSRVEIYISETH